MTTPIIDPQLTAFFAAEPGQLKPPSLIEPPEHNEHRKLLELAIAAAVVVGIKIVRDRLAARHESAETAGPAAVAEWTRGMPIWMRAVTPAIVQLYRLGRMSPQLSPAELQAIAVSYAESLGDYIGESSAEALVAGLQLQLNQGWDATLAWQRAAAAYGLDRRDTRTYVVKLLTGTKTHTEELISAAARLFVDKAVLVRADLIGRTEAWTALETGKALSWLYLQRAGDLPADALREWDTAEDESTCAICAPLDRMQVALDEPFQLPSSGRKLWAPQAHPGCRCHVKLALPDGVIEKANNPHYNPQERRQPEGSPHGGRWATVVEREHTPDPLVEALLQGPAADEPEAPVTLLPQATLKATPTLTPQATLLQPVTLSGATASLKPTLDPIELLREPQPYATHREAYQARRRKIVHTTIVRRLDDRPLPAVRHAAPERSLYVGTDEFNQRTGKRLAKFYDLNEFVNFSSAQREYEFGTVRVEKKDPWYAPDTDLMLIKRKMDPDPINRDAFIGLWREAVAKARPLWDKAIEENDAILQTGNVDLEDLFNILVTAGKIRPDERISWLNARAAVQADVEALRDGNDATPIADAYADWVTWQRPDLLGANGADFEGLRDALYDSNIYLATEPVEQVFRFDPENVHPGDRRENAIVPTGDYEISDITYESALHQPSSAPRPFLIGLQTLQMEPIPLTPKTSPGGSSLDSAGRKPGDKHYEHPHGRSA